MFDRKAYMKKYHRLLYLKNKVELLLKFKKYVSEHREEIKRYKKLWYSKHQTEIKQRGKEYYKINRKKIQDVIKKYYMNHKVERQRYLKNKREIDIYFRLLGNLRSRVYKALKGQDKSAITMKLIGCSIETLKKHLEKQFTEGMSFSNYGKWHVDHIRPCASFDLSKPSQQRKCFHYMNLQPLWAKENLEKNAKVKSS